MTAMTTIMRWENWVGKLRRRNDGNDDNDGNDTKVTDYSFQNISFSLITWRWRKKEKDGWVNEKQWNPSTWNCHPVTQYDINDLCDLDLSFLFYIPHWVVIPLWSCQGFRFVETKNYHFPSAKMNGQEQSRSSFIESHVHLTLILNLSFSKPSFKPALLHIVFYISPFFWHFHLKRCSSGGYCEAMSIALRMHVTCG